MNDEADGSKAYCVLLDEFCSYTGMRLGDEQRDSFYRLADIVVDDIGFSLKPGPVDQEPQLLYTCDFGELPVKNGVLVMTRLLELNHAAFGPARPNFGLSFTTGHVMLSGAMPLAQLDAALLAAMLRHYAGKAKEWRENGFLSEQEINLGSRTSRAAKEWQGVARQKHRDGDAHVTNRKDER